MNYDIDEQIARELDGPADVVSGATLLNFMRKLATPGQPTPDQDLAQHTQEVATGDEATMPEATAHTQAGAPDTSGHLEGEFAVPVEQVVDLMASIVSNSMRQHAAYAYYGEMMRGLGRGELAELFEEQGEGELNEMHYFLRRMGVLMPGGTQIPPAPTPQPSSDPNVALNFLIAGEQQAIVFFKTLRAMLGDNPMKFTIEQIMTDAQEHLDKLWQYMPDTAVEKKASVLSRVKRAAASAPASLAAAQNTPPPASEDATPPKPRNATAKEQPSKEPTLQNEPIEHYLLRQQALDLEQAKAETAEMQAQMGEMQDVVIAHQQRAEQAEATAQQSSEAAAQATEQSQMAQEEAVQAQTQAAAQADAKMRLSIRVQQIRQQLADIVSQDPVAEEGVGLNEQAGPGTVQTATQQGQEQAMLEQQMAAEQEQAAAQPKSKAKKPAAEQAA